MISSKWFDALGGIFNLSITDGENNVAGGVLDTSGGRALISVHGSDDYLDFSARLLIRKAFNLGFSEQFAKESPSLATLFKSLGFTNSAEDGILCRYGDIGGGC